jgi:DNA invertase Pin-like site-specific DNA recombinase
MSDIGYKRVSTGDQKTLRQLEGVTLEKVFEDKASGKDTKRPGLTQCLDYLREWDTLHVHSIDRLARSLGDLERVVSDLTQRGVTLKFHKEGLTFGNSQGSAMDRLLFQVMGAFAQFERALINERSREGIRIAQKQGVRFGAPNKLKPEQVAELKQRKESGESVTDLAKEYGVSRAGAYKMLKQ